MVPNMLSFWNIEGQITLVILFELSLSSSSDVQQLYVLYVTLTLKSSSKLKYLKL